jgi:HAE1 family hydrophobic/amphiphilic exporter-1
MTTLIRGFARFQDWLVEVYDVALRFSLRRPMIVIVGAILIFISSIFAAKFVPKTFLPPQDFGEFSIKLDLPPGANLDAMNEVTNQVDKILHTHPELESSVIFVGQGKGASNEAQFYIQLVPSKKRPMNTSQFKDILRKELTAVAFANPKVQDIDMVGGGMRPFNLNISGPDLKQIEEIGTKALAQLKDHPALKDLDISFRPGKPEVQVVFDKEKAKRLGVASEVLGLELRTQIEGLVPAIFRENGKEYDVRVRFKDDQRNLKESFKNTYVPNINGYLVNVSDVAGLVETTGPANINRQDRGRYVQISADMAANGPGLGQAINDINKMFTEGELKLPPGVRYEFKGQAENFKELMSNMALAGLLAIIFIYLVLASLYESFVTPLTIMLVIPLAACGAFYGLLVTQKSLDLFSMIGAIMLLGVATKNSILLVDYANRRIQEGMDRSSALIEAGRTRLRPILMTTVALIAGMLPVAIGLNEASKQRTSMGVAIIGGLISSTLLTLVVVPAAFSYIDRFRLWSQKIASKFSGNARPKLHPVENPQETKRV